MSLNRVNLTKNLSGYTNKDGVRYLFANSDHVEEMIEFLNSKTDIGLHVSGAIGKYKSKNLNFLSKCKNISHLYIQDGVEDLSGIREVASLKSLIILENIVCSDFSSWKELIYFNGLYHKSIENITGCKLLRKVAFRKVSTKTKTVDDMSLPENIEEIIFTRGNLVGLNGIQKYKKIKRIELNYLSGLVDITGLSELKKLQHVEIESCKRAIDVELIGRLESLETLKITNCGELVNLDFIRDLKHLKFFTFVDTKIASGDLSPLTSHPSLEYAGFMSSRNYNFSFDQIQEVLQKKK